MGLEQDGLRGGGEGRGGGKFRCGHCSVKGFGKVQFLLLVWFLFFFALLWFCLVCFGMVWFGFVWFGMLWFGLVWMDRLVGLVVKASASRAEGPGFKSRLRRDFFGVESYQ